MQKEIKEGNALIAEFLQIPKHECSTPDCFEYGNRIFYTPDKMKYNTSWSWLMPVVEKICHLKIGDGKEYVEYAYPRTFGMLDDEGKAMVRLNGFFLHHADTLIEATYSAVIEFIQHHNSLNRK